MGSSLPNHTRCAQATLHRLLPAPMLSGPSGRGLQHALQALTLLTPGTMSQVPASDLHLWDNCLIPYAYGLQMGLGAVTALFLYDQRSGC